MRKVLSLAVVTFLAGCSVGQDDFNCSSGDENALCGSSRTIYEATNGSLKTNDTLTYIKDGERKTMTVSELKKSHDGYVGTGAMLENSSHEAQSSNAPFAFNFDGDVLRQDVKVMRIWIAPFVDTNDNLHLSSVVYTDIENRSWQIGTIEPTNQQKMTRTERTNNPISANASVDKKSPKPLAQKEYRVPEKEKAALEAVFNNK